MEYRYPKWLANAVLAVFIVFAGLGVGVVAFEKDPSASSHAVVEIALGMGWMLLLAILLFGCFYLRDYYVSVGEDALTIKGLLRAKIITFSSIAQIVTVSTPRGGTDSWLLSRDDRLLAKLDGSLDSLGSLVDDLERCGRPYQAVVFRRRAPGPWEWRLAGDAHWVSGNAPALFRKIGRRLRVILIAGYSLIFIMAGVAWWLSHAGLGAPQ